MLPNACPTRPTADVVFDVQWHRRLAATVEVRPDAFCRLSERLLVAALAFALATLAGADATAAAGEEDGRGHAVIGGGHARVQRGLALDRNIREVHGLAIQHGRRL